MVARDGIEPSTRGFSAQRRAEFGASKPKTGNEFSTGRPNRPARPSPYRAPGAGTDREAPQAQQTQGRRRIATEPGPNPGGERLDSQRDSRRKKPGSIAGLLARITTSDAQCAVRYRTRNPGTGSGFSCSVHDSHTSGVLSSLLSRVLSWAQRNEKSAEPLVEPSANLSSRRRHEPAHALCVFHT